MSLAGNYARAFFDQKSGNESVKGSAATYKAELLGFLKLLEESKPLAAALTAPTTSAKEKVAVVQELAAKLKVSKVTTQFLSLIGRNGRFGILSEIIDALDEVRLDSEGGLLGHIVSAEPLEESAIKEITEAFAQKLKKKVEFKVSTDSTLLAGLKVTVNGVTYDGSLFSQLERLKESFVHGAGALR